MGRARGEQGQVLVAAVGLLFLFILIAVVAIEVGMWLHAKRDAQNDADAMVLAGAQSVTACGGSAAEALAVANQWAGRNDVDAVDIESLYVDDVLNPEDAVYTQLSRDVDTLFGQLIGIDQVTVEAEAEALCSFARMAQGLRPWLVQEEPSPIHADEPCFDPNVSGTHYGGISDHHEPLWGQSCILTWNGGQGGKGEFGPADIAIAREPPDCEDACPHSGASGYRHAIICGSQTTYCVYEEQPVCPNYMIPQKTGQMGNPTRDAIQDLLDTEPVCGDPNHNGIDDWVETFETGPDDIPVAKCLSPRVIPIFIVGNWMDPEIQPKTHYIYHFAALYLEGCTNDHHPDLDAKCDDGGNFQQPGQTQVRVRFGWLMSSSEAGGGASTGFINVVSLIK